MAFFSITSTMRTETGTNVVFVFRPDDPAIVTEAAFGEALAKRGCIAGTRWRFREAHGRLLDPRRIVIGLAGLIQATKFVHPSAEAAPEPADG
ncbi:MAG: hypothetical protein J0I54_00740 [Bosea sp.]|uniref:hypothetical protein n=1 Tax=unclassified Bosea (in: a-proteobacteria) TaxID=2653178 RepID=UPI0009655557|nr:MULTISPECIES: hypothetical protein [unclassified Bosea (in: a-proteobacteria)]MBN9455129.1 hypothetical protein [Bosea sp. (in: a-proteobacteria)]OJV04781.1 MAG: hypothetical protein BGO20_16550 [Bosea sp. 67-29]